MQQVAGIAATAVAGLAITSGGVYAALTAEAFNATPQAVNSGTLLLTLTNTSTSAGFTSLVSDLAPGDVVNRYVQLQNTGTLSSQGLTLAMNDSVRSLLTTDTTKGLQVSISECSTPWTVATGVCPGTTTSVLNSTPAATVVANAVSNPVPITGPALTPAARKYFRVSLTLPASNTEVSTNGVLPANTIQGLSANLTWKFVATQRTAETINS